MKATSDILIHRSPSSLSIIAPSRCNSHISLRWKRWHAKKKKCIRYIDSLSGRKDLTDWTRLHPCLAKKSDSERLMKTTQSVFPHVHLHSSGTEEETSIGSGPTANQISVHQIRRGSDHRNRIFIGRRKPGKWTLTSGNLRRRPLRFPVPTKGYGWRRAWRNKDTRDYSVDKTHAILI
jgi:hypothetical protein